MMKESNRVKKRENQRSFKDNKGKGTIAVKTIHNY